MKAHVHLVLLFAAIGFAATASAGCGAEGYCITCGDAMAEDAGPGGGDGQTSGGDGAPSIDGNSCLPTTEICDGVDNDCDGLIDNGSMPGIGVACSSDVGECTSGVTECESGEIKCTGNLPSTELCDLKDNDCDNQIDENNPEGGASCGSDVGECSAGIEQCVGGTLVCAGNIDPSAEVCDGLDNDCDNQYDEDVASGSSCGPPQGDAGECKRGVQMCIGGLMQCVGAKYPAPEQCDGDPDTVDHDCDGDPTNGFNLASDTLNCGACGNSCAAAFTVSNPHVLSTSCSMGSCAIATCEIDHWDLNGIYADGCEYSCVFQAAQEACNLADDDCDGSVDEGLVPPNICNPNGACATPTVLTPTCTSNGWVCDYSARPGVETDSSGAIVPETLCDGIDNDCDTAVDEAYPQLGAPCDDGGTGACKSTGTYACNSSQNGLQCVIDTSGQSPAAETCNNQDDDCDGTVDENPPTGDLNQWVDLGNGIEIFAYEASRPDATATSSGALAGVKACSRSDVLPWTNVTYSAAQSACAALGGGARLCTEAEWQTACEAQPAPNSSPFPQNNGRVFFEAEDYDANVAGSNHSWSFTTNTQGYSGSGAMRAAPDLGNNYDSTTALSSSPRLDFQVAFTNTGTHYIWVRGYGLDGSGDSIHAGIDGAIPSTADRIGSFPTGSWTWVGTDMDGARVTLDVTSATTHTVSLWMREDGFLVDKVVLTTDYSFAPNGQGPNNSCIWSFAFDCGTYDANTCNGLDNDADPFTPGKQDEMMSTGEELACYADWGAAGRIYDMSGNVKEWTQARSAGINPIRGGAYTNTADGISCQFDFTAADNSFFFPNVGFRCCR